MIKWNTFTLNHPPHPVYTLCFTHALSPRRAPSTPPLSLATLSALSPWLATAGPRRAPKSSPVHRCLSLLHSPSPPHPKVSFLSLLSGNGSSKHILFFSLAIILRVSGQFPQAENNYPLSIVGTLWELYLREKSQIHCRPTPISLPHHQCRQEENIFLVLIFCVVAGPSCWFE